MPERRRYERAVRLLAALGFAAALAPPATVGSAPVPFAGGGPVPQEDGIDTGLPLVQPPPAQEAAPIELRLRGDQQRFDQRLNRHVVVGRASAAVAGGRLQADRIEFDLTTRTVLARGKVRFRKGDQYLQASSLRFNTIQNEGELRDVYGVLNLETAPADLQIESVSTRPEAQPEAPPSSSVNVELQADGPNPFAVAPLRQGGPAQNDAIPTLPVGSRPWQRHPLSEHSSWEAAQRRGQSVATAGPTGRTSVGSPGLSQGPDPPELGPVVACPPELPPVPDWHPHPWAATFWGGQMINANLGDTFVFNGRLRPETLLGVGLQRRLLRAGPLVLEFDGNLLSHLADAQEGGGLNRSEPFSDTPAQSFAEFTGGLGLRVWAQPWLSLGVVQGVSFNSSLSNYERTFREKSAQLLNHLGFELEATVNRRWSAVGRIHHRSGAYGIFSGARGGSNAYLLGLRYRWGENREEIAQAPVPPPLGCPDPHRDSRPEQHTLEDRLETIAMGADPVEASRPASPGTEPAPTLSLWQQKRTREEAIAAIDQRIDSIRLRQRLKIEHRIGTSDFVGDTRNTSEFNDFGGIRPDQLRGLGREKLVDGSISQWRFQTSRLLITPQGWSSERMAFSNDPYTPAQTWLDSEDVLAVQDENGDTLISAKRNRLIVENRLPIPVSREQRISEEEEVENRWVFGFDEENRDGFFIGRRLRPIKLSDSLELQLEPQVMVERAIEGETDSYIAPGAAVGSRKVTQPTGGSDLFGLEARVLGEVLGLDANLKVEVATFNPDNIADGTRAQLDLDRPIDLPILGTTTARLFGAHRFRVWNGSLGDQDVYNAYGASLEQRRDWNWGKLSNSSFWRAGISNIRSEEFDNGNLLALWRVNAYGSVSSTYPLWRGQTAELKPEEAYRYSPVPIVPGVDLRTNLQARFSAFSNGRNQNTLSLTGGPTFTLGTFSKPVLDFTQIAFTGGATLRQGGSPFSFDRAVDVGAVGIGLNQQIAGPVLLSAGVGLNVDPNSEWYGDVTDSLVEVRWQRRSYAIGLYYSPSRGIGGFRFRLNDFDFKGTGVPFVPYQPNPSGLMPGMQPSLF